MESGLVMGGGFGTLRFVFVELRFLVMVEVVVGVVVVVVVVVLVVLMTMVGIDDTTTAFTSQVNSVHVVVHGGRGPPPDQTQSIGLIRLVGRSDWPSSRTGASIDALGRDRLTC